MHETCTNADVLPRSAGFAPELHELTHARSVTEH